MLVPALAGVLAAAACSVPQPDNTNTNANLQPPAGSAGLGNDLQAMDTLRIAINGTQFEVWVARSLDEVLSGLMFVSAEQMAPTADGAHRGMLFEFQPPRDLDFWMKDTYIQLDIAFARSEGTIVQTYTMQPLETVFGKYISGEPVPFALEVRGGLFSELGISPGDVLQIPDHGLNGTP